MAGTNLSFPYDSEIFNYDWKNYPDVILTSMIESGAVIEDSEIAQMISNGSNFFTVPFYNVLGGSEDVYNGVDDFTDSGLTGGNYSGCVFGRMKRWSAISFIKDFNSGADPMAQIVAGVAQYWNKMRQTRLIAILEALFGITGDSDWDLHKTSIVVTTDTAPLDANKIGETSINDACVKACGDNASAFSLVIAHSVVANRLANLQLLNYLKYTDSAGITRALPIGTINGKTLIVNDSVPVATNSAHASASDYTTYILGLGAIRYASAPVDVPSEMDRDPKSKGGVDIIYTRKREVLHPYGFSFKGNVTTDKGIPDAVLTASASYERKYPAKSIFMARLITNG